MDQIMKRVQCRYLSVNKNEQLEKLGWMGLEKRVDTNQNNLNGSNELIDFVPGGGIAQQFFKVR